MSELLTRADGSTPAEAPIVAGGHTVVPVLAGDRALGIYVLTDDGVRWYPVHAHASLAALAVGALGLALGGALAARHQPVRTITMGPGGWVSFKGTPPRRAPKVVPGPRAWWASALRARRLAR